MDREAPRLSGIFFFLNELENIPLAVRTLNRVDASTRTAVDPAMARGPFDLPPEAILAVTAGPGGQPSEPGVRASGFRRPSS